MGTELPPVAPKRRRYTPGDVVAGVLVVIAIVVWLVVLWRQRLPDLTEVGHALRGLGLLARTVQRWQEHRDHDRDDADDDEQLDEGNARWRFLAEHMARQLTAPRGVRYAWRRRRWSNPAATTPATASPVGSGTAATATPQVFSVWPS